MTSQRMKIINALCRAMDEQRIVSLKEVVSKLGISRLTTREVMPIVQSLHDRRPDYEPIRFLKNKGNTPPLFDCLNFVEVGTELETEDEFLARCGHLYDPEKEEE